MPPCPCGLLPPPDFGLARFAALEKEAGRDLPPELPPAPLGPSPRFWLLSINCRVHIRPPGHDVLDLPAASSIPRSPGRLSSTTAPYAGVLEGASALRALNTTIAPPGHHYRGDMELRYRAGALGIFASMAVALINASALEFFESRPARRKPQSRHSDGGEGAVNLSD
jgi:hypothetical protein